MKPALRVVGHGTMLAFEPWRPGPSGSLVRATEALRTITAKAPLLPPAPRIAGACFESDADLDLVAALAHLGALVRLKDTTELRFDDGVMGRWLELEVEPKGGRPVTQLHVFRRASRRLHHLIAALPSAELARALGPELRPMLSSYTPL